MSTVIPIPVGGTAGLITLLVANELALPDLVGGVAAVVVGMGVLFGWAMHPRLPNGGGV